MQHLYFCRHGLSEANLNHLWGGHTDSLLTDEGRTQAHDAGSGLTLQGTPIDLIICSPLVRAHETARIIAGEIGYPEDKIVIDDRFKERSFGDMDGKPNTITFLATHNYKATDDFPNAERIEALQRRAADGLEFLKALNYENILLVGHGAYARGLVRTIEGRPYTDEFKMSNVMSVIPNAKVIQLL